METWIQQITQHEVDAFRYAIALVVFLVSFLISRIFTKIIQQKIIKIAEKTANKYDDLLAHAFTKPASILILVIGIHLSLSISALPLPSKQVDTGMLIVVSLLILWTIIRLTDFFIEFIKNRLSQDKFAMQFVPLLHRLLRVVLICLGVVFIAQNVGLNVGSLLAGLGIGGLAVALAAQDALGNFFGSVMLLIDRPFQIGDWVKVGEVDGDVERMGFRSTGIRTWEKSLVSIPNKALSNSVIENYSKMNKRRVKQLLGLTYDTQPETLLRFVEGVESILRNSPVVHQEYMLVKFTKFGDSALEILVYYFTTTTVWLDYLTVAQENNCSFLRLASELGVSFAFPTRTLHLHHQGNILG